MSFNINYDLLNLSPAVIQLLHKCHQAPFSFFIFQCSRIHSRHWLLSLKCSPSAKHLSQTATNLLLFVSIIIVSYIVNSESCPLASVLLSLSQAILCHFGLISNPIKFRPKFLQATAVVPLPIKGSRTMSPTSLLLIIKFCMICNGFIVGCSNFSLSATFACS